MLVNPLPPTLLMHISSSLQIPFVGLVKVSSPVSVVNLPHSPLQRAGSGGGGSDFPALAFPVFASVEDADLGLLFVDFVPDDSLLRVIDEVVDGMLKCSLRKIWYASVSTFSILALA